MNPLPQQLQPPPLPPPLPLPPKLQLRPPPQPQPRQRPRLRPSEPNPTNLPCGDLIGSRDDYNNIYVPLYNASIKSNWGAAEVILRKRPELVGYAISENYDTALHIVASAKSNKLVEKFVENLVNRMTVEQLELPNKSYNTALCLAAAAGNVEITKIMVKKHSGLLDIPGNKEMMPLYMACLHGHGEMVKYLYDNSKKMTGEFWTPQNRGWVLEKCVEAGLFDVALKMVTDREEMAVNGVVIGLLARNADAFREIKPHYSIWRVICQTFPIIHEKIGSAEKPCDAMQLLKKMWPNIMKLPKPDIDNILRGPFDNANPTTINKEKQDVVQLLGTIAESIAKLPCTLDDLKRSADPMKQDEEAKYEKKKYSSQVLFIAAEMGNTEFVAELIHQYPDLLWKTNDNMQTIFHVAVLHRREGIYNFLQEVGSMKDHITSLKDEKGNNMLHLVGKNAKTNRLGDASGYVLQMHRELLWFKEVESIMPPFLRERKNKDGLTPQELFTKEHKDLRSAGEKWMKDTASQCMVVAALIATMVFTAVFAVPGADNQDNGMPVFLHKRSFIVFVIADAISLTFSSISILIFLSIHIASYFEQDFLESLPDLLMKGLTTLFLSIAAMMFAFSVSFFVLYQNNFIWVPVVISAFTSIPVFLFVRLQYKLLADVSISIYDSKNLFKPGKSKLYLQNPKF